jgi:hypothetical protein
MAKPIDLIIQLVRMARYGTADEFESAEGNKEYQFHVIPKIADNRLDNSRAKSDETRQSNWACLRIERSNDFIPKGPAL